MVMFTPASFLTKTELYLQMRSLWLRKKKVLLIDYNFDFLYQIKLLRRFCFLKEQSQKNNNALQGYQNDNNLARQQKMHQGTPRRDGPDLTPSRTPLNQQRSYLSFHYTQGKLKQQVQPYHQSETPHMIQQIYQEEEENNQTLIWGTNISTAKLLKDLKTFIEQFQDKNGENSQHQKIYIQKLQQYDLDLCENNLFDVNAKHLKQWDQQLYYQLIYYPAEVITIFDQVIKDLFQKYFIDPLDAKDQDLRDKKEKKKYQIMVSIKYLSNFSTMRSLRQKQINRLICFSGIVIRCSEIYPEMKTAVFQCINCKAEVATDLIDAKVQEPKSCENCKMKNTFHIVHKYCHFTDKQYVKLQQLPENVPQGQTPTSMNVLCYDSNVNGMRPGDRVQIVGIFRCQPRKVSKSKSTLQSVFYVYTDIISFRILQQNRFRTSLSDNKTNFNEQDKQKFYQIASSQTIIQDLVNSFAPSIAGHDNIKKGLLAQVFGGTHKQFEGRGRFRSDINVCLVGDPSTAKSQLLKKVNNIAPRGIYTSGKGSSAVGLTANVRKDPQTRQFILESGALVLSDLGICCIDQFDKMNEDSKLILLQAMEQQTISVAKAGIVCQLNSRTSILSAANPSGSKYDMKKSVVENIRMHPALLSRFDLIYIILDIPNEKTDRRLAAHILNFYTGKQFRQQKKKSLIEKEQLAKYITYAREYIAPKISKQAAKKLTECYLEMRRAGMNTKTVSATPRQLQSMIRISEAFAKMKLSSYVVEQDVIMAHDLIKDALKQSATDPTTGMIDMDVIVTGNTSAFRKKVEQITIALKDLFKSNQSQFINKKIQFDKIVQEVTKQFNSLNQQRAKDEEVKQALMKLQKEGLINLFGNDRNRPIMKYLGQDFM